MKYKVICGCCAHKRALEDWYDVEANSVREAAELASNPDNDIDQRVVLTPEGQKIVVTFRRHITYTVSEEPYK